jgi:hypothetical protein
MSKDNPTLIESSTFPRHVIAEIQRAAKTGIYDIRGFGAKRDIPTFDDLVFLGASTSRYPLEGYREKCTTEVVLGNRFAKKSYSFENTDYNSWYEFWLPLSAS